MTVRLIVFTLVALSLVNAYSFVRMYSSTYVSSERQIASIHSRKPASIPSGFKVETQSLKSHVAFDLNCGPQNKKRKFDLKVSGQWTQLKGRMCRGEKLKLIEITNLDNGFTASIFSFGVEQYQTDLIQLKDGANKIRVRITPEKGPVEEQTVIVQSHSI